MKSDKTIEEIIAKTDKLLVTRYRNLFRWNFETNHTNKENSDE